MAMEGTQNDVNFGPDSNSSVTMEGTQNDVNFGPDSNSSVTMEGTQNGVNFGPDSKSSVIFRCKKCRRIIATEELIVPHNRGDGKCFKWRKKNDNFDTEAPECSSIFVEPMKWMQTLEDGYVGDKLQCVGCKTRLGSFNWAGMRCNCGTWVIPAFQLHKSRMDECRF